MIETRAVGQDLHRRSSLHPDSHGRLRSRQIRRPRSMTGGFQPSGESRRCPEALFSLYHVAPSSVTRSVPGSGPVRVPACGGQDGGGMMGDADVSVNERAAPRPMVTTAPAYLTVLDPGSGPRRPARSWLRSDAPRLSLNGDWRFRLSPTARLDESAAAP